jgi:hypothetical protein
MADTRWILLLVLVLSGCGSRVHVVDQNGLPIVHARISTYAPSFGPIEEAFTDSQGDADCPRIFSQDSIEIEAPGYGRNHIDFPEHFPVYIILSRFPAGSAPDFLRQESAPSAQGVQP